MQYRTSDTKEILEEIEEIEDIEEEVEAETITTNSINNRIKDIITKEEVTIEDVEEVTAATEVTVEDMEEVVIPHTLKVRQESHASTVACLVT